MPTKVAILGGGIASVIAAFRLSDQQLGGQYQVTVYQQGWRLGGKCASGRNTDPNRGMRIEEHGLHVWFGFYDHAFKAMRECFQALNRPSTIPIRDIPTAFLPCSEVVFCQADSQGLVPFEFFPPPNSLQPGVRIDPPGLWQMIATALGWLESWFNELNVPQLGSGGSVGGLEQLIIEAVEAALEVAEAILATLLGVVTTQGSGQSGGSSITQMLLTQALQIASTVASQPFNPQSPGLQPLIDILSVIDTSISPQISISGNDPDLLLFYTTFDAFLTIVRGVIQDDLFANGFDSVNDQELSTWLTNHGADPRTLNGAFITALYDQAFAYKNGVAIAANRNVAAGAVISGLFKLLFEYKGAFLYKMRAGMGDTIFAPFYQLLQNRGVKFEFFTCVEKLHLSADKKTIESIDVIAQATINSPPYKPLITVNNLPCWPNHPDWSQLEAAAAGKNFERDCNPLNNPVTTLHEGADFDLVVLGIPVGALASICSEVTAASNDFSNMINNAHTVRTQAFQTWCVPPLHGTSATLGLGYAGQDETTVTGFVEPIDTYADMTHLLPAEQWPPSTVNSLGYFCGVLDETAATYDAAQSQAKSNAINYLQNNVTQLWPNAAMANGGFNWNVLYDPSGAVGNARFDAQYPIGNYNLTDRYVQTWPGTLKYRLAPFESGFDNLFLVGDWTRNGLDLGCVEAAVISGELAATAIIDPSKINALANQLAAAYLWLKPWQAPSTAPAPSQPTRSYVEYGGLTSAPQPDFCRNTTLYGFLAQADLTLLQQLCDQVFTTPSGGAVVCQALARTVLLTFGNIRELRPALSPFSQRGYATEKNVTIWVPVKVSCWANGQPQSQAFAWFVPYAWVDNPLSLVSGRDIYGFAKQWGWIGLNPGQSVAFSLDAFGGNYNPSTVLAQAPLLRLTTIPPTAGGGAPPNWPSNLAAAIAGAGFAATADMIQLLADFFSVGMPLVFLKESRSVIDGTKAALMQITSSAATLKTVHQLQTLVSHFLFVLPIDSHPLVNQLGLTNQPLPLGFQLDLDFTLDNGKVLWDSSSG